VSIGRAPIGGSWVPAGQTTPQPWTGGIGPGPLIAEAVTSTCTAGPADAVSGPKGVSGSTSIINGVLGLTTDDNGVANSFAPMPANPRPNDGPHRGVLTSVGDSYEVFYNEQDTSVPGAITVTAIHMRLLGPTAVGDLYVGRAECGVQVDRRA
jgi:hypothetical protein